MQKQSEKGKVARMRIQEKAKMIPAAQLPQTEESFSLPRSVLYCKEIHFNFPAKIT